MTLRSRLLDFLIPIKLARELVVATFFEIPSRSLYPSLYPSLSPFVLNGSPRETRAHRVCSFGKFSPTVMGENISLSGIVSERTSSLQCTSLEYKSALVTQF